MSFHFSHSPAIKKVITVYKDWIQVNKNFDLLNCVFKDVREQLNF